MSATLAAIGVAVCGVLAMLWGVVKIIVPRIADAAYHKRIASAHEGAVWIVAGICVLIAAVWYLIDGRSA